MLVPNGFAFVTQAVLFRLLPATDFVEYAQLVVFYTVGTLIGHNAAFERFANPSVALPKAARRIARIAARRRLFFYPSAALLFLVLGAVAPDTLPLVLAFVVGVESEGRIALGVQKVARGLIRPYVFWALRTQIIALAALLCLCRLNSSVLVGVVASGGCVLIAALQYLKSGRQRRLVCGTFFSKGNFSTALTKLGASLHDNLYPLLAVNMLQPTVAAATVFIFKMSNVISMLLNAVYASEYKVISAKGVIHFLQRQGRSTLLLWALMLLPILGISKVLGGSKLEILDGWLLLGTCIAGVTMRAILAYSQLDLRLVEAGFVSSRQAAWRLMALGAAVLALVVSHQWQGYSEFWWVLMLSFVAVVAVPLYRLTRLKVGMDE